MRPTRPTWAAGALATRPPTPRPARAAEVAVVAAGLTNALDDAAAGPNAPGTAPFPSHRPFPIVVPAALIECARDRQVAALPASLCGPDARGSCERQGSTAPGAVR